MQDTVAEPPRRQRRQRKQAAEVVKLVVTGLSGTGKSAFIESISQYTEWQNTPHNSWFFGRVRVDESLILHFLEPPIGRQFDYMGLRHIMQRLQATGYVVLMDSTQPQHFGEFVSIVHTIRGFHADVPLVVAANKQDSPYAWSPDDIRLGLGIRDIPVMPCIADQPESVREIVIELLYQVLG